MSRIKIVVSVLRRHLRDLGLECVGRNLSLNVDSMLRAEYDDDYHLPGVV
jgi:hypothetical protein